MKKKKQKGESKKNRETIFQDTEKNKTWKTNVKRCPKKKKKQTKPRPPCRCTALFGTSTVSEHSILRELVFPSQTAMY